MLKKCRRKKKRKLITPTMHDVILRNKRRMASLLLVLIWTVALSLCTQAEVISDCTTLGPGWSELQNGWNHEGTSGPFSGGQGQVMFGSDTMYGVNEASPVLFSYTGLPTHSRIHVENSIWIYSTADGWEGTNSGSNFDCMIIEETNLNYELLRSSFQTTPGNGGGQCYPVVQDSCTCSPGDRSAGDTGTIESAGLNGVSSSGRWVFVDEFDHDLSSVNLRFEIDVSDGSKEFAALDFLRICVFDDSCIGVDCDDGLDCTIDTCNGGICSNVATNCTETPDEDDDDGDEDGGSVSNALIPFIGGSLGAVVFVALVVLALGRSKSRSEREQGWDGVESQGSSKGSKGSTPAATVEDALDRLNNALSIEQLMKYTEVLLEQGRHEAALALALRLEKRAAGAGAAPGQYIELLGLLGTVMEANGIADGASDIRTYRATLANDASPKKGKTRVDGAGVKKAKAKARRTLRQPNRTQEDLWEASTVVARL